LFQFATDPRRYVGDVDYGIFGSGYSAQRRPDPRIAALISAQLGDARTVLNVGAGSGSYEPPDRHVIAIEPSGTMRAQRPRGLVPAIEAYAEALPLDDGAVDASMALVTVHQWSDAAKGLAELRRVTQGSVLVMTFDGEALDRLWLAEYAPELIAVERGRYPAIKAICQGLGGETEVLPVPVPVDCVDGFAEAFYARPEAFLDPAVRRSQSAWSFLDSETVDRIVGRLRSDLESGDWARRFGTWKEKPSFEGSLRLIVSQPV